MAPTSQGGRQAWVEGWEGWGTARWTPVDLPQTAGEQSQDVPPPSPITPHRRGAAATSRVSLPPRRSRSATCFYQYEADPQGLPQVGSVLLLTGQPPLRHLKMISHDLHSARALKTSSGRVGGVGREGPSARKPPGVFSQRATFKGHPGSPTRWPPKLQALPPTAQRYSSSQHPHLP